MMGGLDEVGLDWYFMVVFVTILNPMFSTGCTFGRVD